MKKTTKPTPKKLATKKLTNQGPRKSGSRDRTYQAELVQMRERLHRIEDKLDEVLGLVIELNGPTAPPAIEPMHQPADEHADDVEVASTETGEE